MKDIKSLYLAAKSSMKPSDISSYESAVHEILESNPQGYISNLEYIISSDIGLRSLKEFVETKGLPIRCYDSVMAVLEKCLEKCQSRKKDDAAYKEAISYMESFRHKYAGCFMMESFFSEQASDDYVETYYASTDGVQNRKLAAGMIKEYGEEAIPDVLITADSFGEAAINTTLSYIENHPIFGNPVIYEWVLESVKNFVPESNPVLSDIASMSVHQMVENVQERNHQIYRESVITGNDDLMMEYSEIDVKAIKDLISINEYKLTWADELNESTSDIQNKIYSLYEELDGIMDANGQSLDLFSETVADSVMPLLPNAVEKEVAKPMNEGWLLNTRNKKTGEIPGYLRKNHNLGYGEDDNHPTNSSDTSSQTSNEDVPSEPTLDDFKRPSAQDMSEPYSGLDDDQKKEPEQLTPAEQRAINNYYYYTYNNSLNKNTTGSFNRDSSTHTTTKKTVDDHSSNKRINSDDTDVVDKVESVLALDVPFSEGVLGVVAGIVFFGPIVLGTGSIIGMTISSKMMKKKYTKKVHQVISGIVGKQISDDKKFLAPAKKLFSDILKENEKNITGKFYKLQECGESLDLNPSPFFSFGMSSSHNKDMSKCNANNLMICAENVVIGLMKKEDIKPVTESLNKISSDIKFGFTIDDDLPGDDNGGNWSFYIKAGICEGGPDDSKDEDEKWLNAQIDAVKKSGYVVVQMTMTMPAKKFLIDNFGKDSNINEAVGDADKDRPQSDHPVKDVLTDIDRELTKKQQGAKKAVQNVQNVGRAFVKPAVRTKQWITNMVSNWKDADENNIKEKMADPHARSNLFSAIRKAIIGGSLLKAGLLLNPVFLALTVTRGLGKNKREFRLRNEMIGELKTELGIIDEKIKDADRVGDNKAKYQLMRFKNELNKKLLRVGGSKEWKKII